MRLPLLEHTSSGLFCARGGFAIDPSSRVENAVITHAHSDHARRGSRRYFCERSGEGLLRARLGRSIEVRSFPYGERFELGGVRVSFHPAGHILGSAQVRIESEGEVWVASGDYKREADPSCAPFELVPCDVFVTEATFGAPSYIWTQGREHGREIAEWWRSNARDGYNSLLFGYSLGKAQRILAELRAHAEKPIFIHPTMQQLTECYRAEGVALAETRELDGSLETLRGELILAPPSVLKTELRERIAPFRSAFASGWMQNKGAPHLARAYDTGFVLSDHADWDALVRTALETGARRVFVQHRNGALVRELRKRGIEAHPVEALERAQFARLKEETLSLFPPGVMA
jgi:putative mRNA 3-end processing factor